MLYIKDIPHDEELNHYCTVKLGKYFNEENGCKQYFCRIRRCTQKRSSYCAYIAVETSDKRVLETEVNHFYHYKAFDQAVRKMNRKLQGIAELAKV